MSSEETPSRGVLRTILAALGGFGAACLLIISALFMVGAGHGWTSPFPPSLFTIVAFPLLGIAIAMRPSRQRLALLFLLIVIAVIADVRIVASTRAEGVNYVHRVMRVEVPIGPVWFLLWSGAQAAAIAVSGKTLLDLRRIRKAGSSASLNTTAPKTHGWRRSLLWSFGSVLGAVAISFAMLYFMERPCVVDSLARQVRPGMTEDEVRRLLGEPAFELGSDDGSRMLGYSRCWEDQPFSIFIDQNGKCIGTTR